MAPSSKQFRRLAALGATLAAVAAPLAATGPSHAERTTPPARAVTSASLTWTDAALRVKVDSPRAACERGRRVIITFPAQDSTVGIVQKSSPQGVVRVAEADIPRPKSLAYVLRTSACQPTQSNVAENPAGMARRAAKARTTARLVATELGYRVKVASAEAKCVKNRRVDLLAYSPGEFFAEGATGFTNGDGVFRYPPAGKAGAPSSFRLVAFVRAAAGCGMAQSNLIPLQES